MLSFNIYMSLEEVLDHFNKDELLPALIEYITENVEEQADLEYLLNGISKVYQETLVDIHDNQVDWNELFKEWDESLQDIDRE